MKQSLLFFLLLPLFTMAQLIKDNDKEIDPNKMEISKNIFRVLLSLSTDTKFSATASYEREIFKPITVFIKAGPACNRQYTGTDAFGTEQYKWLINAIASGELRYYFSLKRKIKLQRMVKNFSTFYFSLEEQLMSKPLFILNKSDNEISKSSNREFVNVGYQHQKFSTYLSIYVGARFPGNVYSNTPSGIDLLHGGVTIGKVF